MKKILLPVFMMTAAFFVKAQTAGPSMPLTFEEALAITMSDNPQLTASRYEEKAAMQERKAAFGLRLPNFSVAGAYAHLGDDIGINLNNVRDRTSVLFADISAGLAAAGNPLPPQLTGAATSLFGQNWGYTIQDRDLAFVGGTLTLPIFTGGKINAANRAARIHEKTVREKREQTKGSIMSELVERYYGLLLANQAVVVRQQVVDAMQHHLRDAQAMEASGVIPHSEVLYMEVKLYEAERDLSDAKLQAATTLSALCNTLDVAGQFNPVSYMFIMESIPTLAQFKELALENNPQLKQAELQRQLAVQGVNLQRSEFMPQVVALGAASFYNYQVSSAMPKWVVGAGVSIKIFDGLQKEYKFSAAKNTVRQVESLQYKAEQDIQLLVEKLYNEVQNYSDRIPSLDKSLEFATEYLRVKNAAYREGMATSVDVVDAELNLAKTKIDRLQTAYDYDLSLAKLLEAAGLSGEFPAYASGPRSIPVKYE